MAVRDLTALLREASPALNERRFSIHDQKDGSALPLEQAFALIREAEGWTIVEPEPNGDWALITMSVASDLEAVGFTAAFAGALAAQSIPSNVIAAFHHDHILVP
jgi:uncharacterized protein